VRTAPTESAAANPPPAPPAPAEQLRAVLRPLPRSGDGSYRLRLELSPPDLGRVDLHVELRDGVMHASIRAEHARTAELVRNALDDLRSQLDADGVRAGDLNVDDSGTREQREQPEHRDTSARPDPRDARVATMPTLTENRPTRSDALLDVRI
jgi:flagellar hook-length control protein FliK